MPSDRQELTEPTEIELQAIPSPSEGGLGVAEYERHVPFVTRRVFFFHDVPKRTTRGGHAHRKQQHFIICISGHVTVMTETASGKSEHIMDSPSTGLYLPPMTWVDIRFEEEDCAVLVLTCSAYDEADYIRDYQKFLERLQS